MAETLSFPHIVYRGTPAPNDEGKGTPTDPVQCTVVADQEALDAALKDGWRLHRMIPAAPVSAQATVPKGDDDHRTHPGKK